MHRTLNDQAAVHSHLRSLCDGFFEELAWIDKAQSVEAAAIDPVARSLLAHKNHMTETLSEYHGEPVALYVHDDEKDGDRYRRKIELTVDGGARVVELGVIRLDLSSVDGEVRSAIVKKKIPLGEILESHKVLTRVEPKWFVRFAHDSPVGRAFRPAPTSDVFGRIGLIYCNHKPVMELLEVVSP